MAVAPGTTIQQADLDALAVLANSRSTLAKLVNPLYNDTGGNPFGHREFRDVAINAPGINYKVGELLTIQYGSIYSIEMVSATGGVLGIRIVNSGGGQYLDSRTSPGFANYITGGSGSGCKFSWSAFAQVGPTLDYNFGAMGFPGLAWNVNLGNVTGYYRVAAGTGYHVNDQLTFTEQPQAKLTVLTVDANGAILTFSLTSSTNAISVPQNIASMNSIGGSGTGAKFGGYVTFAKNPDWATELMRLRNDISGHIDSLASGAAQEVSGPWPKSGFDPASNNQFYCYEDTGQAENIVMHFGTATNDNIRCSDFSLVYSVGDPAWPGSGNPPNVLFGYSGFSVHFSVRNPPGSTMNVTLSFSVSSVVDGDAGIWSQASATITGPGTWTSAFSGSGPTVFTGVLNGLADGDYTVTASVDGDFISVWQTFGSPAKSYNCILPTGGFNDWNNPPVMHCVAQCTDSTVATPVQISGIDSKKNIFKIAWPVVPDFFGFGFTEIYRIPSWTHDNNPPPGTNAYTQGPWSPTLYNGPSVGTVVLLHIPPNGFWFGTTPMVSSLNTLPLASTPWNAIIVYSGPWGSSSYNPVFGGPLVTGNSVKGWKVFIAGPYNHGLPIESQAYPPRWVANRFYVLGSLIMDSNGNWQQAIAGGPSGAVEPSWGFNVLAPLQEQYVDYKGDTTFGVQWRVKLFATDSSGKPIQGKAIKPAIGRLVAVPKYPAYWQTETNPFFKPPVTVSDTETTLFGTGSQWNINQVGGNVGWNQANTARGFWIYRISPNRFGLPGKNGVVLPRSGQVNVTIGCIRNGSFVAFGTYQTGHTYTVFWPIFTSDALVYQASERVDLQATAISAVSLGTAVAYPVAAAHYLDTQAMLSLVS